MLFQRFWAELAKLVRVYWEKESAHMFFGEAASPPLISQVSALGPLSLNILSDGLEKIPRSQSLEEILAFFRWF